MRKAVLFLLLCFAVPAFAQSPATVTGNLQTLSAGQIQSGSVRFQLSNIGTGNPPSVIGIGLFPRLVQVFTTDNTGAFSVSIWGNDNINPANTIYLVTYLDNAGNSVGPIQYSITGASVNLNTLGALNGVVPPILAPSTSLTGNNAFTGNNTILPASGGNIAARNFSADHTVYVSTSGNDSNDGLSWGTAKLTVQAAINTATGSGANGGTVMLPCGSLPGPTTWQNGLSLISVCSFMVPGVAQTALTYSSTLTLANLTGVYLHNIVFDFNFTGAGLSLGNAFQGNTFDGFTLKNCGNSTTDCLQGLTTTAGLGNNAVNNLFSNFYIQANITGGQFANCITLKGTTSSWTNSRFINGVCTGNVNNGLVLRANTDTDYFINYLVTNNGPTQANSGCLVINDQSPASDVDADGHMIIGMSCLGNFTNTIRAGQTTGSYITMGGLPNGIATLGGTPLYSLQNIVPGPSSATADLAIGGKLSACGATPNCTAGGSLTGDVTAQRTATSGAYFLGSDGGSVIYRNVNGVNISTPGSQAINFQTSGTNGAVLLGALSLQVNATAFASLGAPGNGTFEYCNDCTIANPCAGGGTGALAKRLNGVWVCN